MIMLIALLVIVHEPASAVLNVDPVTVTIVSTGPVVGESVIGPAARTVPSSAVSAETNRAMVRMSRVTAYLVRRTVSKLSTLL